MGIRLRSMWKTARSLVSKPLQEHRPLLLPNRDGAALGILGKPTLLLLIELPLRC